MSETVLIDAPANTPHTLPKSFMPTLALANLGIFLALLPPVMASMAFKISHIVADPKDAPGALGLVLGVGALFALIANPLFGRLSDRTMSKFGKRRPWILGGVVVGLASLAVIGAATSIWVIMAAWCVAQTAFNAVLAATNATVPDQVPAERRGAISGIVGMATPVGILGGVALVNVFAGDVERFVIPGLIGAALVVLFVLTLKDRRLETPPTEPFGLKQFFGSFVFNPAKHPDFGWTWLTKFLVMFGYAGVGTYMPYYLANNFHLGEQEITGTLLMTNLASVGAMMISGPIGGIISDKVGKRRPFVALAGVILVIGLVMTAFAPSVPMVILAQAILGFGGGAFFSVDLALATQVLPDPDDTAKDLGVLNIANALPQSLAPAMGPAILAIGAATGIGQYQFWYLFGAAVSLAGAVLVYRIKSVK